MKLKQVKYLIYALTGGCILMAALFGITNSIVFQIGRASCRERV